MDWIELAFWGCLAVVAYTYLLYPLVLLGAVALRARPVRRAPFSGSVSCVLAAHNEADRIAARREELASLIRAGGVDGEIVIVSDGSTDATAAAARAGATGRVRVIEMSENVGKAVALSRAVASCRGDVVVFADARQRWAPDALTLLLENFADPSVGGVTGDLCLEDAPGATAGVGLYWRYEKGIRKLESRLHSTVGATGAISAVRRELFRPIPARTLLDDVYWPMRVVMQGFRVVHDERACAFDRLPDKPGDEFRRKVRTLSGNFQLVARLPSLLLPWRNPLWIEFVSHKLLRLAVPWLLIVMLVASAALPETLFRAALLAQLVAYALAVAGLTPQVGCRSRLASAAASFVVLNAAAWMGFWIWALGRSGGSWKKVTYATPSTAGRAGVRAAPAGIGTPGSFRVRRASSRVLPVCLGALLATIVVAVALVSRRDLLRTLILSSGNAAAAGAPNAPPGQPSATDDRFPAVGADAGRNPQGVDEPADLYVAENGSDANSGIATAPFRTLQHAADAVKAGQTVRVRPGTYAGMNFYRQSGGSPGRPIRFLADPGVVINTSAKVGPNADSGINLEPGKGWFVFSGFRIVNSDGTIARACIRVSGNSDTQITGNTCEKGGTWGIIVSLSDDVLIQGNLCANSLGEHGLYVGRAAKRVIVRRNIFRDNNRDGFHLNGGTDGPIDAATVEGNVIFGNQFTGIDADGVQNSAFRNNLVYGNGKHAVTLYNNDTRTGCTNNLFVNNTLISQRMFAIQMKPGSTSNRLINNILLQTAERSNYGSIGTNDIPTGLVEDFNIITDRFSLDLGTTQVDRKKWYVLTGQGRHSIVASASRVFADALNDDFRLRPGSPAVDAGRITTAPNAPPVDDLLGNRRPEDKGIDIGAYELIAARP